MNNIKVSMKPCPICRKVIYVVGVDSKGKKIGSCGHSWSFKQTRSQKELKRKYITTLDGGLELKGNSK